MSSTGYNSALCASFLLAAVLVGTAFCPSVPLFAQALPQIQETLLLDVSPSIPRPESTITVTARSYLTDLARADIAWIVNGNVHEAGPGLDTIELELGKVGEATSIQVVVGTHDIGSVSKSLTLRPAEVDLLWEADTYTPPFYEGKALPSSRSGLRIVATPNFTSAGGLSLNPEDLIYTWERGSRVLGSLSGRGKNTLEIEAAQLYNQLLISVRVESVDGTLLAGNSVLVPALTPEVVLYEDHPTRGMLLERALPETFDLEEEEVTLTAIPFFFSTNERNESHMTYSWSVDGTNVAPQTGNPSSITLRPTGGSGRSSLSVDLRNQQSLLQIARSSLSINYESGSQSSPF
jgi:hypothetical protein